MTGWRSAGAAREQGDEQGDIERRLYRRRARQDRVGLLGNAALRLSAHGSDAGLDGLQLGIHLDKSGARTPTPAHRTGTASSSERRVGRSDRGRDKIAQWCRVGICHIL